MNRAVFIDKDGTLIPDIPYNVDPSLITLQKNAVKGLRYLQRAGYLLVVISNQSGVAKGFFDEKCLLSVEGAIRNLLADKHIRLDGFYYCPHHPDGIIKNYQMDCECRKPKPGLILRAARDLNIDLSASWMIGDILHDIEAGNKAGCKTILIDNGNETEWVINANRQPTRIAQTINEAAEQIMYETLGNKLIRYV